MRLEFGARLPRAYPMRHNAWPFDDLGDEALVTFLRRIPDAGFVFARIWLKHRRAFRAAPQPPQQNRLWAMAAKTTREARRRPTLLVRSSVVWSNSKSDAPPVLARV